ncbi:MAG: radical SAM/SPASM domain-containing protein [Candidatus Omnitrophota bacterium]|jgi:MoaA/NifB/PqqE/SkfB family radical SAM enzyme|nr:MAG: radical SAM/SPASM domain-containing protein [Candidatus Omnitrophota bacterium]
MVVSMKIKKLLNLIHAYMDLLLAREKPCAFPVELSLGTTSFCNLKCIHCPREGSDGNLVPFDEHLDMDYFREFQPYLERAKDIYLYGLGEPMIDNRYFEKVRYVASFGGNVGLSSNGTLLDEKRCREVVLSGIKGIGISLDASSEEVFRIVRPPGGLPKIIENIKRLESIKKEYNSVTPIVKLSFGIMRQNLHDLPFFPDVAEELHCNEIIVHPIVYMSEKMKRDSEVDRDQLTQVVEETREKTEAKGIIFSYWDLDPMTFLKSLDYAKTIQQNHVGWVEQSETHHDVTEKQKKTKKSYFCFFLWRNAMVQGKGEVFPCCYITNMRVGKIQNGNLRELRGRPLMASLRKDLFEGNPPAPCAKCPQLQPFDRWTILKSAIKEMYHFL